jgi:TolB protein
MNHEYLRRTLSVTAPALTRRHALMLGAAGLGVAALSGGPAQAVLRVDVNEGNVQPIPIALPDFQAGSPADVEVARGISQIITGNLKRSGLFAPIDHAAFIEKITNTDAAPRFPDWRAINAQALVTGRIARQADGRVKAEYRLWDVLGGAQLNGQQYFTTPDNFRRIAHIISDSIYERLTGEKGYFDSRVVFVDERNAGPSGSR